MLSSCLSKPAKSRVLKWKAMFLVVLLTLFDAVGVVYDQFGYVVSIKYPTLTATLTPIIPITAFLRAALSVMNFRGVRYALADERFGIRSTRAMCLFVLRARLFICFPTMMSYIIVQNDYPSLIGLSIISLSLCCLSITLCFQSKLMELMMQYKRETKPHQAPLDDEDLESMGRFYAFYDFDDEDYFEA